MYKVDVINFGENNGSFVDIFIRFMSWNYRLEIRRIFQVTRYYRFVEI